MEASLGWVTITGYAMIQNVVFFFLFLTQQSAKRPIKWILAFISLCAGLLLFEQFFRLTFGYERFPHIIFAMSPLWYLIGPLLYFYLRTQLRGKSFSWVDLLHLLPMLFVFFNSLEFYGFSAATKLHYIQRYGQGEYTAPVHNLNYVLFLVQVAGYVIASLWLLKTTARPNPNQRWHLTLLVGMVLFAGLGMLAVFSANAGNQRLIRLNSQLFILWLTAYIFFIFIRSTRRPEQLYFKYKNQLVPNTAANYAQTMQIVSRYLQTDKPYRDPNYNIHQLAQTLGYSKNHLQQAIKKQAAQSFRDLLNTYRIEEAKAKLAQPENRRYTIQSIAESVGFQSPATFYRVFKKKEGLTPTAFVKYMDKNR